MGHHGRCWGLHWGMLAVAEVALADASCSWIFPVVAGIYWGLPWAIMAVAWGCTGRCWRSLQISAGCWVAGGCWRLFGVALEIAGGCYVFHSPVGRSLGAPANPNTGCCTSQAHAEASFLCLVRTFPFNRPPKQGSQFRRSSAPFHHKVRQQPPTQYTDCCAKRSDVEPSTDRQPCPLLWAWGGTGSRK